MIGVVVVAIVVGVYFMSEGVPETPSSLIVSDSNVGTVGLVTITCPEGFSVISITQTTIGDDGSTVTIPTPQCKAPNPSDEVFSCGDERVDSSGMVHTIECDIKTGSTWTNP